LELVIKPKLLVALFCLFILFTVIGTVSHECGHYAVMKYYGYGASIHYSYCSIDSRSPMEEKDFDFFPDSIINKTEFSDFYKYIDWYLYGYERKLASFHFDLGGPVLTLGIGTLGLVLLFLFRRRYRSAGRLTYPQWLLLLASLFWLRPVANLASYLIHVIVSGNWLPHGHSDEEKISLFLGLPIMTTGIVTAAIGLVVLILAVFYFIPKSERMTFLVGGLTGGIAGYYLWLIQFGRYIMP